MMIVLALRFIPMGLRRGHRVDDDDNDPAHAIEPRRHAGLMPCFRRFRHQQQAAQADVVRDSAFNEMEGQAMGAIAEREPFVNSARRASSRPRRPGRLRRDKMNNMRLRVCAKALLCILLTSALQGCLLTRILETRMQLCDEQPTRVIVAQRPGSGLRVLFEKPTLTDRDVVRIVGYPPTEITGANADLRFSYEALPIHRQHDRASSLVVRLSFTRLEGEYKLSEVEIPEKFNSILSPPLLDAAVRAVCTSKIGIVPPGTTFDLADLDRATLPNRDALMQLLGMPTSAVARSNDISYQYCLAPCGSKSPMVANLKFAFGRIGELLRADANYFRYLVVIDLNSSKAIATIELD